MDPHHFFDPDGNPIDVLDWASRFEDIDSRILASDTLPDGRTVQTLWHGTRLPEIGQWPFGTAVFDPLPHEIDQYDDKETALRRHAEHVERLRRSLNPA